MKYLHRLLSVAALFIAGSAFAQNAGTVANHAFVLGKGAGTTGYTSLLCGSAQLAVGQSAADPICRTITGDVTISAAGVTAIGATKVTSAMLNADVFSTAHTWAGQQTFVAPILGTPASGTLTNATGLPIATGVSGLGAGVTTFLATPSSANLRAVLTDEVGTGAAYFVGGALGTPASGTLTNATGLPISTGVSGLGTGVAAALGVNTGSAGAFVVNVSGSFSPVLTGTTVAGSCTYTTQIGSYEQIGRSVIVRFSVAPTSCSTAPTGNLTITGLPVASANVVADNGQCFMTIFSGWTGGAGYTTLVGAISPNTTTISLFENGSGKSPIASPTTEFNFSSMQFQGFCSYHT